MFGQRIYLDIDFIGPLKSLDERVLYIDLSLFRRNVFLFYYCTLSEVRKINAALLRSSIRSTRCRVRSPIHQQYRGIYRPNDEYRIENI